jgi:hypothetical protein
VKRDREDREPRPGVLIPLDLHARTSRPRRQLWPRHALLERNGTPRAWQMLFGGLAARLRHASSEITSSIEKGFAR